MAEPLKFKDNGKPVMPLANGEQTASFPSFLTSTHIERIPVQKSDTRLKIFSGTANPLLAQVSESCKAIAFLECQRAYNQNEPKSTPDY